MSRALWTAANIVMFLMFAFSVAVQYNDPDPARWMAIYALAAIACLLSLHRGLRWWFPTLVGVIALVWAATITPRVVGQVRFVEMFQEFEMKNEAIEESREMYGLVLITIWMMVVAVRSRVTRVTENE